MLSEVTKILIIMSMSPRGKRQPALEVAGGGDVGCKSGTAGESSRAKSA